MNFRLIAMWDYILYFFFGVRVVMGGVLLGFFGGYLVLGFFLDLMFGFPVLS